MSRSLLPDGSVNPVLPGEGRWLTGDASARASEETGVQSDLISQKFFLSLEDYMLSFWSLMYSSSVEELVWLKEDHKKDINSTVVRLSKRSLSRRRLACWAAHRRRKFPTVEIAKKTVSLDSHEEFEFRKQTMLRMISLAQVDAFTLYHFAQAHGHEFQRERVHGQCSDFADALGSVFLKKISSRCFHYASSCFS